MNDAPLAHDSVVAEPATSVMAQLRLQTAEHHAAIERAMPLMAPDFDRARYLGYLDVMARFHRGVEQALGALPGFMEALPDFDERRKVPLLDRDLRALGAEPPTERGSRLPPLDSVARGLGVMYVLEGSTLGGRILSRHLQRTLSISPEQGGAYLASYGERLSLMWRRFGTQLETWATGRDTAPVIESARATFACLGDLFAGPRKS